MFSSTYAKDSTTNGANIENTVVASTNAGKQDKVVAPGTMGSMSFSIKGTPEVATQITVDVSNVNRIHLGKASYILAKGKFADEECKLTTDADYEPIKWYFGTDEITDKTEYNMTLGDLQDALVKLKVENGPNVTLDKTYYIGWK